MTTHHSGFFNSFISNIFLPFVVSDTGIFETIFTNNGSFDRDLNSQSRRFKFDQFLSNEEAEIPVQIEDNIVPSSRSGYDIETQSPGYFSDFESRIQALNFYLIEEHPKQSASKRLLNRRRQPSNGAAFNDSATAIDPGLQENEEGMFIDRSELLEGFIRDSNLSPIALRGEGIGGVAWIDYDNDADLDLFLPNGKAGQKNALFRNNGDGTFTNVAAEAGVEITLGLSGVVVGDLNNDGFDDIFAVGEGHREFSEQTPTVLYLNNGDGTFAEVSNLAGVPGSETALAPTLADINNDGYLDIFIGSPGHADITPFFGLEPGIWGGPGELHENKLYLNNGPDATGIPTFTDITASAGLDTPTGAFAAGFLDYNNDGWLDLFVANMGTFPGVLSLYRNNGDLTFTDVSQEAGIALNGSWMSATFGDYDNDGDIDIFVANAGEGIKGSEPFGPLFEGLHLDHGLFRNNGDGTFTDVAADVGLDDPEYSWGASFADYDNDGDLDLYFVGSDPDFGVIGTGIISSGRLYFNDGTGNFELAPPTDIPVDLSSRFASGVGQADFNNDGFADLAILTSTRIQPDSGTLMDPDAGEIIDLGTPVLLQNTGNDNNWLTVRLEGTMSNTSAIGTRVTVVSGELSQVREVYAGTSFVSSESPWPSFGLGEHTEAAVTIEWQSGEVQTFTTEANQMITVVEPTEERVRGTRKDDVFVAGPDGLFDGINDILLTGGGDDVVDAASIVSTNAFAGNNHITTGRGDDLIFVGRSDRALGGQGRDRFDASNSDGDNEMFGGQGRDEFQFSDRDSRGDHAYGGSGNDTFWLGLGGGNQLTGGAGRDTFWIVSDGELPTSTNAILDFHWRRDRIGIGGFAATDLSFGQDEAGNGVLSLQGQAVATFEGVSPAQLVNSTFIFQG